MKPRSLPIHTVSRATLLATSLGLAVVSHAADQTWIDTNSNNDWSQSDANWVGGGGWVQGNNAIFGGTGESVFLLEEISVGNITFNAGGYTISDNTLSLGATTIDTGSNSAAIGSDLGGTSLTKAGAGNLTLTGANFYSGATAINGGVLQIGNGLVNGSVGSGGYSIAPSATLFLNYATATAPAWANISGGGTLRLNSAQAVNGSANWGQIAVGAGFTGTLQLDRGRFHGAAAGLGGATNVVIGDGGQFLAFTQPTSTFSQTFSINGMGWGEAGHNLGAIRVSGMQATFTGDITLTGNSGLYIQNNAGGAMTVSGAISGGYNLALNSLLPSGLLTLSGANTYTGTTTISGPVKIGGSGTLGGGNYAANITNNGAFEYGSISAQTLGGVISGTGSLIKSAASTLTLNGANTYSGSTTVNDGTLVVNNGSAWASGFSLGTANSPKLQINTALASDAWIFSKGVSGNNAAATFEKTGPGSVTLTASQSSTAATVVSGGALRMQSSSPLPTGFPSIPGMKVWLDAADPDGNSLADTADGASIATWVNKGTLGTAANFNATATGTNNPTYKAAVGVFNNKPTINFVATDKMLANSVNFTNTVSVVYVGRIGKSDGTGTKARLVTGGTGTNWILGYWGGNMNTNYWNGGNLGTVADTNPHIWINGATNGAYAGYRFDGGGEVSIGTGTASQSPTTGLTLGGVWATTTERSDGDIAELFVFDHQLTTLERQQIEGYLYNKYYGTPAGLVTINSASPVSVANGATFGGYGSAGNATVAAGGTIQGGTGVSGALTLNNLTFSGAGTVSGAPSASAAPLVVTGTLTTGGANSLGVAVSGSLATGTHHLIQYGTLNGSLSAFKFAAPTRNMTLANNPPYIDVVVAPNATFPIWTGAGSGQWNYAAGSNNWKLSSNSSATDFYSSDSPLFDDSATGTTALSLSTDTVNCGVITFNNSSKNYSLTQSNGKDIASGSLVKTGSGSLTISGAFSYFGGSTLNGGTVSINSVTGLGTGGRSFGGSTLEYTGATGTMAGTTTINAGGATIRVTDANTILTQGGILNTSGTGALTKQGDGTLVLPLGSGTYSNAIAINGGTLNLDYGANGATLTGNITGSSGILRLDGAGANPTSGLTLTGNNTFSGETHIYSGRRIFLNSPSGNAINGDIVVKQGEYPVHGVSLMRNEQIVDTALLRFEQPDLRYDFRLGGFTETLAGIVCANGMGRIGNGGSDGGADTGIAAAGTLVVSGPGTYLYHGNLLDQSVAGGPNGVLNFTKSGTGTQILNSDLAQTGIAYTGITTVNSGVLELRDTNEFDSPVVMNGGALVINQTGAFGDWNHAKGISAGSGSGEVRKLGGGLFNLTGANTYTGTTTVEGGTLKVTGSLASPLVDVQLGATLSSLTAASGVTVQGNGTLSGVTFASGSTLQPGTPSAIGTLTGGGTITFAAGSTCVMQVDRTGGTITSDQLADADTITYGGTLTITATGQAFANGDVVSLFPNADVYQGAFSTFNLPGLPAGLSWDLSSLATNGTVHVVNHTATPVFSPPSGGYAGTPSVTITSDSGSTIHYTIDGSTPTLSSPSGASPLVINSVPANATGFTIRAFARKTSQANSPEASATYNTTNTPTWNVDNNGSWSDAANWLNEVIPDGTGVTADFNTLPQSGASTVTLDSSRTVGGLIFGNTNPFNWSIDPVGDSVLTLATSSGTPTINVVNNTATINARLASTQGLLKTGAGTAVITNSNGYTGATTVSAGTLALSTNALATTSGYTLNDANTGSVNTTLRIAGAFTANRFGFFGINLRDISPVVVASDGTGTTTLEIDSNTAAWPNGLVTIAKPLVLKSTGASGIRSGFLTISGNGAGVGNDSVIYDATGSNSDNNWNTYEGPGTYTPQPNTYLGNVRFTGGTSIIQNKSYGNPGQVSGANDNMMIPDAASVKIDAGSGINFAWGNEAFDALNDGVGGGGSITSSPTLATITVGTSNGSGAFSGVITSGLSLTKAGTGTQTLSGINTYTGATTVAAGTLAVNGSLAAASAVTVNSAATLAGTGTVSGTATVQSGATIAPGGSSTGTLTVGNASLTGTYQCQLGVAAGDTLAVTGTLTVNAGAQIVVSTVGTPTASSYTILTYGTLVGTLPTITPPSGYSVDTSTAGVVKLVSGSPYTAWINGFPSLTNPADKTTTADPDKDGLANIIEFVINGNPTSGTATNLPTITQNATDLVFTYLRRDDAESFNPTVEFNSGLTGSWTTAVHGTNCTIVVAENGAAPDTVTVTIPKGTNLKLFARLKVMP